MLNSYKMHLHIIENVSFFLNLIFIIFLFFYFRKKKIIKKLDINLKNYKTINHNLKKKIESKNFKYTKLKIKYIKLEKTNNFLIEKQKFLIKNETQLNNILEICVNNIFEKNKSKTEHQNFKNFEFFITPIKIQLNNFQKILQDNLYFNIKDNNKIYNEINILKKINEQIVKETTNFTNIIKGNNKLQGNWGEMILNKILENSGLREGYDYIYQNKINHLNKKVYPDVIVKLPKGKDIIIDSKMTLIAYRRYYNSENEDMRKKALKDHINAIKNHITNLSNKNYNELKEIRTLDYVLMFIPIDSAFILAINHKPELINEAYKLNIMIVSPSTLLITLRTINNLWKHEQQNKNAKIIADKASKMYEKFRLFVDDIIILGKNIDKIQCNYSSIIKKLSLGKGSLIKKIENFKTFGIEIKKPINSKSIKKNVFLEEE